MTLMFCVSCALLLIACGGYSTLNNAPATNAANSNTGTAATNTSDPASTALASAADAGDRIAVPECEEYVSKYEACVSKTKVSEARRAQSDAVLAQMRKSWRDRAANPQNRASLAQACKTAMEVARESMKQMGCEF